MTTETGDSRDLTSIGLAFVAGTGLIVMGVALAIGVIEGDRADGGLIAGLFVAGLLLFGIGIGAWIAYVKPHQHFDDINEPQYFGHHEEEHGDESEH